MKTQRKRTSKKKTKIQMPRTPKAKHTKRRTSKKKRRTSKNKKVRKQTPKHKYKIKQLGGNPTFYTDVYGVKELTSKDFKNNKINNKTLMNKPGMMMFYADWCPHCSNDETRSAWGKLGRMMDPQDGWVGAMNCADKTNGNNQIATRLGITGYPTIKFINKNGAIQ